ncbi:MAG TPA: TonB-dependent receptor [Bryobacteraceae bacterium]|nr:TonB-dependent receptor [Bryobacteraceae bacterium]
MRLSYSVVPILVFVCSLATAEETPERVEIPPVHTSIVITAAPLQVEVDRRNSEVFDRTLFSRDDQIFHVLDGGINAGQHEGGGKSVEIRRFGFNLDHGGVNGGLKVLLDNVQQNQGTQGHGQGYLGSLKLVTPELIQEVNLINGPFSAEYGDFSGLGVVHIRLRESLPDELTARVQGGSFGTARGFLAWSPYWDRTDSFIAWEGSRTDGPFDDPLRYKRNNLTANVTRRLAEGQALGFKFNGGLNDYYSSGQIPLDEVAAGRLGRLGAVDSTNGGMHRAGTAGVYYRQERGADVLKADAFFSRSLWDLYSNFTFFLNNSDNGDAIQQHDSRIQEGANVQYLHPTRWLGLQGLLTTGANYHDNQINVGLYPRVGRVPTGVTSGANVRVTNGAGYVQQAISLLSGKLQATGGLRYDVFRFDLRDRVQADGSGTESATKWQPKFGLAFTPSQRVPLTLHANYGRGISTSDARAVVQYRDGEKIATTDFFQVGAAHQMGRFSVVADLFLIDRSNERVYIPDDGTFEFKGPSRAYGAEAKASVELTRVLSFNGGITQVANAFYRATAPRLYVDSAPRFTANAGLTLTNWRGWSGSLRMRAINSYRLDGEDATIRAEGHTVWDLGVSRRIRRGIEFNFTVDNMLDRSYYETQNYFESRLPGQDPAYRIHATPGYPLTVMAGLTFRLRGK